MKKPKKVTHMRNAKPGILYNNAHEISINNLPISKRENIPVTQRKKRTNFSLERKKMYHKNLIFVTPDPFFTEQLKNAINTFKNKTQGVYEPKHFIRVLIERRRLKMPNQKLPNPNMSKHKNLIKNALNALKEYTPKEKKSFFGQPLLKSFSNYNGT
jgi:hypothetical protein